MSAASAAARPPLHVLRVCGRLGIFAQLRLEEALLRCDSRSWCLLNAGSAASPAIVMGASGDARALVDGRAARACAPAPALLRRFSGGGTVVVDGGTLLVSLVCNAADVRGRPLYPREVMAWSADAVYAPALAALGVPAAAAAGGSPAGFSLREHDYCVGARKFGGNAQSLSRARWVHHTSVLWAVDAARMRALRMPARRPAYRADRAHADFVVPLADVLAAAPPPPRALAPPHAAAHGHGFHPGAAALFPALLRALADDFTLVDTPLEEALAVAALPQERVGTQELALPED
jgi:lipoate-protein ligase A